MNKNNIFVDTNVLIGAFAPGKRFQAEKKCWEYISKLAGKRIYVSSLSVAQFASLFQKRKAEKEDVMRDVRHILAKANVAEFSEKDIEKSLNTDGRDLEDNMQLAIACKVKCGIIITQNKKDYPNYLDIDIVSAEEYRSIDQ